MPDKPPAGRFAGSAPTGAAGVAIGALWVCVSIGLLLFLDGNNQGVDEITITYRCPTSSADFCRAAAAEIEKLARERGGQVEDIGP